MLFRFAKVFDGRHRGNSNRRKTRQWLSPGSTKSIINEYNCFNQALSIMRRYFCSDLVGELATASNGIWRFCRCRLFSNTRFTSLRRGPSGTHVGTCNRARPSNRPGHRTRGSRDPAIIERGRPEQSCLLWRRRCSHYWWTFDARYRGVPLLSTMLQGWGRNARCPQSAPPPTESRPEWMKVDRRPPLV